MAWIETDLGNFINTNRVLTFYIDKHPKHAEWAIGCKFSTNSDDDKLIRWGYPSEEMAKLDLRDLINQIKTKS